VALGIITLISDLKVLHFCKLLFSGFWFSTHVLVPTSKLDFVTFKYTHRVTFKLDFCNF
jgi:hypothetical protein